MARKVITHYVDDIDGSDAEGTVLFSLEGVSYEIDLSADNKEKLSEALKPYIEAGRKTGGRRSSGSSSRGKSDSAAIRAWATENNIDVPARGRIPAALVEQYNNR